MSTTEFFVEENVFLQVYYRWISEETKKYTAIMKQYLSLIHL
jgi:hypothetical protein